MLPEEVAKLIGKRGEASIMEVESGAIKRYSDAVGDDTCLYTDADYANAADHAAMIAPYGYFGWPVKWKGPMPLASELRQEVINVITKAGCPRVLDGGIEYEFYALVFSGDTLIAESVVADIQEKEGKTGRMFLTTIETTYRNIAGSVVGKERKITIQR